MITACALWVAPMTSATQHTQWLWPLKAEVDSLLQRVLDLDVRLKTDKSLRLQVLALEERNHLESKIAMLRSNIKQSPPVPTTDRHKGTPPKNSLPITAKSLPHSSIPLPFPIEFPTFNPQATEHAVAKSTTLPKSFCIVWGCTPEVLVRAISPILPKEDSKNVVV